MSLITNAIPRQGFEIIRDRICQILAEEFDTQFALSYDTDLDGVKIYMERMVAFDHTELSSLNVGIERGDYSNQHQGYADGVYRFFIEHNTIGETDTDNDIRGDKASKVKVQKLMGVTRAILEDPIYKTLGFAPGFIGNRHIESFVFAEPTRHDMEYATMARMILVVKCMESTPLKEAQLLAGWDTHVKLHDTDKGYYWSTEV